MNVTRLLTEPVQIGHRSEGAVDDYGNATPGATSWTNGLAYIEQSASTETNDDRDTTFIDWRVFLPAGTVLGPADVIEREDETLLEVIGAPWSVRHPRSGLVTHIEARARASRG